MLLDKVASGGLVAYWWVADGKVAAYGLRSKGGSVAGHSVLRDAILRGIGLSGGSG
jgi:hypothetical protein